MTDLEHNYRQLLSSPELLSSCQRTKSIPEFLTILKSVWNFPAISDDSLLGELQNLNQQIIDVNVNQLAGQWLPYRYHAKPRSISWCIPDGPAFEPFQDQTITRYRQQLINQLLSPKTSLSSLLEAHLDAPAISPTGFIFHLSRCGSTLVSGSGMELASANVLSESPPLTECLLDTSLTQDEKQKLLMLLLQLQAQAILPFIQSDAQQLIVKWNAWDILQWPLIRSLYPQVPVIFLTRKPVEILASHQKSTGRHMAGDPAMATFDESFALASGENMLAMRIRVLKNLLIHMNRWCQEPGVQVIDYRQLTQKTILDVIGIFALSPTSGEREAIAARMGFNSKELSQSFSSDSDQKQLVFNTQEREQICTALMPLYDSLLKFQSN